MKKYDESSIERFAGLAGVRKKPTPYVGPTDGSGLWTIWREPADNFVDQALAGRNSFGHLIEDEKPNTYWVVDRGQGIPVGRKDFEDEQGKVQKFSTLYVVTGLTHGGSNFSGDTISRGTHGLGIKVTNALSTYFKVWTYRDGDWYSVEYAKGKLVKDVVKDKKPKLPHGIEVKKGTVVKFCPDLDLFKKDSKIDKKNVTDWCELTSYLVPGLEVHYTNSKGKTRTYKTKGPEEYIGKKIEELGTKQTGKSFVFQSKEADIAVAFTDIEGERVDSYTNGLKNSEGGEHLRALVDALSKSLLEYTKKDKKGKLPYTPSDLRDGLVGLVNYKISAPQFNNQPKDKLIDDRVYAVAFPQFVEAWAKFWLKNKGMAKDIVARATLLRTKTSDFLKDKKLIKNVNAAKKGLNTKLAGIVGKAPLEDREIYYVEGDSAGGLLKRARNKKTQAVYPLKGKPLNPIDTKKEKINNNAEIVGMLASLGMDLNSKTPEKTIKYGKIIMLADADVDGQHINCLMLAVLWKYTPHLVKGGHVYSVVSPLYKARKGDKIYFGMTKEECYEKAGSKKLDITYIKGWGEIDEVDLAVALDPSIRKLIQIEPPSKEDAAEFLALMGSNVAYRKKLLGVL